MFMTKHCQGLPDRQAFMLTITRILVAGIVFLTGNACLLDAVFHEPDISGSNVKDIPGLLDPGDGNDAERIHAPRIEPMNQPDRVSVALSLIPALGSIQQPAVQAHSPRAPPRFR